MKTEVENGLGPSFAGCQCSLNKAPAVPKTPLDTCAKAIQWAADAAFEDAIGRLMVDFMRFGQEGFPEWRERAQQLVSQRLAVAESFSHAAIPSASPQSTPP